MDVTELKSIWPDLGPPAIDSGRIEAARGALAAPPPPPPERPNGLVAADVAATYAEASRAHDLAMGERQMSYAGIFHDPAVIAKLSDLNARTVAGPRRPVEVEAIMTYLRTNGLWLPIKAAALAGTSQGAMTVVDYNEDVRTVTINLDLPIVDLMLQDLQSHALLTAEQVAAIKALADTRLPWWQSAGFSGPIGTGDLEAIFVASGEALI